VCISDFGAFHRRRDERANFYKRLVPEDRKFVDELMELVMAARSEAVQYGRALRALEKETGGHRGRIMFIGPCTCEEPKISVSTAFTTDGVCYACMGYTNFEWKVWAGHPRTPVVR
jgi:hypothetical protein